ncbi:MAG: hypothetical protein OXH31_00720 [Gammaproteobacteria bacterium]|nr:hypothetical protein [Gammaproteobacteria bacterium]
MLPKLSLLDELRKGGFEASLITTFNAYLPFYENVVLRRLITAGNRHNILLMDAGQFKISLEQHPPRFAGRDYTLAPIGVPGAFHPKLIFLAGQKKGLIVLGSHNMTLAGFGFNRELTNVIPISVTGDEAGVDQANRIWSEIKHWVDTSSKSTPSNIRDSIFRFQEFAPWLGANPFETDNDVQLLAGRSDGPTLWEQLCDLVNSPVKEIFLTGAFFDKNLDFLNRIQTDLQPDQIVVAIDPNTVEIPTDSQIPPSVRFVHATNLGTDSTNDAASGYLHAKGMFLRQQNNDCLFVSGSANPSRPAWLASNSDGNTELMVARLGAEAESASQDLGFTEIPYLPVLNDNDWQTIANSPSRTRNAVSSNCTFGVAIVKDDEVYFASDKASDLQCCIPVLLNVDHQEIVRGKSLVLKEKQYVATFNQEELSQACFLRCVLGTQTVAILLLHHSRIVEDQARTGIQREFRTALLSLQTESPDIELLIRCVDKITLSDEAKISPMSSRGSSAEGDTDNSGDAAPDGLAIDVSEIRQRKSRHRLTHSSDFGYLLDTLIFHLRFQEERTMESVDHRGRSEEEQVGEDDSEDADESGLTQMEREKLLNLCHTKVHTVVRRITKHLNAYAELSGEAKRIEAFPAVLFRLMGVLAVLRELRRCDGRAQWVDQGKTTVPVEERTRLFREVMFSLIENEPSLLHMEKLSGELVTSEDVARLKGMLLWLAWDSGVHFEQQKPFMETPEKEIERLETNAMLLALAQTVRQDELVIEEARQSIGGISTSGNLAWIDGVHSLATKCDAIKRGESPLPPAEAVKPGDVVIRRNIQSEDLRIVASVRDDGIVSMFKLSQAEERDKLRAKYLFSAELFSYQPETTPR